MVQHFSIVYFMLFIANVQVKYNIFYKESKKAYFPCLVVFLAKNCTIDENTLCEMRKKYDRRN